MTLLPLLAACRDNQDALLPRGPHAREIAELWWVYTAVVSFVFVLVSAFVVLAILRRRSGTSDSWAPALSPSELPADGKATRELRTVDATRQRKHVRAVSAAAAFTLCTLVYLLYASVDVSRALETLSSGSRRTIQVEGNQWWWRIRYKAQDHTKMFETANELHVPVGETVAIELTSADVIHSFWVPNLHGKLDLIPGRTNTLYIRADKAGVYRGQCAEFCGYAHAKMSLLVIAEPPAQFARWLDAQRKPAAPPRQALEKRGQELFMSGPCAMCHSVRGTIAGSGAGPDLTHLQSRRTLAAASLPNTRGNLAGWVLNAQSVKPGNRMPNINLPADELHALLSYLETLR